MDRKKILHGYAKWIEDKNEIGFDTYMISFMFAQIGKSERGIIENMKREIREVYAKLITRVNRRPNSIRAIQKNPLLVAFPDIPVFKKEKISLREAKVNGGVHYQGWIAIPYGSRLKEPLMTHIVNNPHLYLRGTHLERIYVEPIDRTGFKAGSYCLKCYARGERFQTDDLLVLPLSASELSGYSFKSHLHRV